MRASKHLRAASLVCAADRRILDFAPRRVKHENNRRGGLPGILL